MVGPEAGAATAAAFDTLEERVRDEQKRTIERIVREFNEIWLAGDVQRLASFFHPEVVMVAPGGVERLSGREAMIQSFREYLAQARTLNFEETSLTVDVFDDTAVATLGFRVRYELGGLVHDELGTDVLVFSFGRGDDGNGGGAWRIVWRTQIAASPSEKTEP